MSRRERHQLILNRTYADGSQEWACPACGRRLLLQWPPAHRRIVLEPGDEQATHDGDREQPWPEVVSKKDVATKDVATLHESGLADLWLEAIAALDFSSMPDWPDLA